MMSRYGKHLIVWMAVISAVSGWAQDSNRESPVAADPQALALVVAYAQTQEEIGPQEQAMLREEVALMLKEMEALGYTRRVAVRAALEGVREAMAEIRRRLEAGEPAESGEQLGDLLRTRLRDQLRLTLCDQTRTQLREQDRDQLRQRPNDLVPGGPGGYGPHDGRGKY
jgi:hypothetical protein